jgi:hypothetical protein
VCRPATGKNSEWVLGRYRHADGLKTGSAVGPDTILVLPHEEGRSAKSRRIYPAMVPNAAPCAVLNSDVPSGWVREREIPAGISMGDEKSEKSIDPHISAYLRPYP